MKARVRKQGEREGTEAEGRRDAGAGGRVTRCPGRGCWWCCMLGTPGRCWGRCECGGRGRGEVPYWESNTHIS